MEIRKSNFKDLLPLIRTTLLGSEFISIDCELTGLRLPESQFIFTDSPQERYVKLKACVENFSIIQYGVSGFKYQSGQWKASSFNFYVHASSGTVASMDRLISFSSDSLRFLRSNQFDFNKLIDEGIPYFSLSEETTMLPSKHGKLKGAPQWRPINEALLPAKMKKFLKTKRQEIQRWLDTDKPNHVLQVNNGEQKKLIFTEIQDPLYNGDIQVTMRDSKHLSLIKTKSLQLQRRVVKDHENFRTVIEIIQEATCPIIAHNATFDLLHTVHHFWQRLPTQLTDFKEIVGQMWPTIIDTKYLLENHPKLSKYSEDTQLEVFYKKAIETLIPTDLQIVMNEGFDDYTDEKVKNHEAGYDAYITGVVYIALNNYLSLQEEGMSPSKRKRLEDDHVSCQVTQHYLNKIFVGQSITPYFDLKHAEIIGKQV